MSLECGVGERREGFHCVWLGIKAYTGEEKRGEAHLRVCGEIR